MRTEIELGQKFGKWTVIDSTPIYTTGGQRNVKVQCTCGRIEYKHWSSLRLGKTTQCLQCSRKERRTPITVGEVYKYWTVIGEAENFNGQLRYKCKCKCGHEQYLTSAALTSTSRWFQCKNCSNSTNIETMTINNGKVGELTLSKFNRIKSKSMIRKIEFNLTIEYLWNLYITQNRKCAITGSELPNILEASLDRIDSSKGYIEGNVQWVTVQANKCKHVLSMSELYEFAKKVLDHANQQPSTPLTKCEGSETNP